MKWVRESILILQSSFGEKLIPGDCYSLISGESFLIFVKLDEFHMQEFCANGSWILIKFL